MMSTSPFLFGVILCTPSCWISSPMLVLLFWPCLQLLGSHRAQHSVLCCISSYPDNKLHQSWLCLILNPANAFYWEFTAPLEPSLLMVSVFRNCVSARHEYPDLLLLLTAEIFSPSQPSFSHLGLKVTLPELMGLGNSTKKEQTFLLFWHDCTNSAGLQCFSSPFSRNKEEN